MDFPLDSYESGPKSYTILSGSRSHFLVPSTAVYDFEQAFKTWRLRKFSLSKWLREDPRVSHKVQLWSSKQRPPSIVDLEGWSRSTPGMAFQYDPDKQEYTLYRSVAHSTPSNPSFSQLHPHGNQQNDSASFNHSNMQTFGSIPNSWAAPYFGDAQLHHSVWPLQGSHQLSHGESAVYTTNWPEYPPSYAPQPYASAPIYWGDSNMLVPYYSHPGYSDNAYGTYTEPSSYNMVDYSGTNTCETARIGALEEQIHNLSISHEETTEDPRAGTGSDTPLIVGPGIDYRAKRS